MKIPFIALTGLFVSACGGSPEPAPEAAPVQSPAPEEPVVEADAPAPVAEEAGTGCTSAADCAEGEMCTGPEGCDVQWTCQPQQACTRDLVTYCGCDGETITGSGSCPPAPYAHRGEC